MAKKVTEVSENREQFIGLAKEVYPLMQEIRRLSIKYGFGEQARMTLGSEGYMEFAPYDTGWRMNKYSGDSSPMAQFEYRERVNLGEA